MKTIFKITLLVAVTSVTAFAFDWTTEFKETKIAAEKGDPQKQCGLGSCYLYGTGTPINKPKAMEWFQKAAAQGNLTAQAHLSYFQATGTNKQDKEKGILLLNQTAIKNGVQACKYLVQIYKDNVGAAETTPQGIGWAYLWTNTALLLEEPNSPKTNSLQSRLKALKQKVPAQLEPTLLQESQRYAELIKAEGQ
ncbi:MAG: tetratricopeptide repeat protein [Verrucomicrobiota bacterium]